MSDREPEQPGTTAPAEAIPEPPPYDPDLSLIGDMQRSEGPHDSESWMTKLIHRRRAS